MHSVGAAQIAPSGCGAKQVPARQKLPDEQSEFVVQVITHCLVVLSQRPGLQSTAVDGWQVPLPSQVKAGDSTKPLHEPARHTVPEGQRWHAPRPSHTPVRWQVACGSVGQASVGSVPAFTGPQMPSVPLTLSAALQVSHGPSQMRSQQKPLTQNPL